MLLGTLLGGASFGSWVRFIEPRWLDVCTVDVGLSGTSLARTLRVLHLSDLHYSSVVSAAFLREAFERGLELAPDVVVLTGDYITCGETYETLEPLVDALRLLTAAVPTFASLGNHDGGRFALRHGGLADSSRVEACLRDAGAEVLDDRNLCVDVAGSRVAWVGLRDSWSGAMDVERAFHGLDGKGVDATVVLAHNPDEKTWIATKPWDLQLSGHTHGGQVRIPLYGAPYLPTEDPRYIAGLGAWCGRSIYVTRGVGNLRGVRLLCRPEVTLLRLASL